MAALLDFAERIPGSGDVPGRERQTAVSCDGQKTILSDESE